MTTQHYKENWQRANTWLSKNAPDYVRECVQEVGGIAITATKEIVATHAALDLLEIELRKRRQIELDSKRVKWYHWLFKS